MGVGEREKERMGTTGTAFLAFSPGGYFSVSHCTVMYRTYNIDEISRLRATV